MRKVRRGRRALVAGLAALTLAASLGAAASAGSVSPSWPMWQGNMSGSRYNPAETVINPSTVGSLKLKWAYAYNPVPFTPNGSQPAIVDGVLYVGVPDAKFLALDAKTGATKWTFDLTTVVAGPNGVRDGATVAGDKVYFGDGTGRVYALYKSTGQIAWVQQVDSQQNTSMTSSPLVFDGHVYIGVSTSEGLVARDTNYPCCTHRGQVVSLDASSGAVSWRYYTVPPAAQIGTWPSGATKYAPSGASVWASPVVDPRTRTLFIGTGQNFTGMDGDVDAMLAIDADTGQPRWKHSLTFPDVYTAPCAMLPDPGEYCPGKGSYALDADVGATANLIDTGGRTLVAIGQKSGVFRALDALTGSIVWQTTLANMDVTAAEPGEVGNEWGSVYDGRRIYVATHRSNPGHLFALDPATGKILWQTDNPADGCTTGGAAANPELCELAFTPAVSGSPGLVYEGSADGKFRIFSAANGCLLWTFDVVRDFTGVNGLTGHGTGLSGNGGAVIVNGMVYVQAGYYPFYPTDKGAVLLAFGL